VETDQGQAGKELAELKSLTIPVKITGTFDKPKFKLDLEPVLKAKAREEVKRQKKKLKKKAEKKLEKKKDEVKKKLEDKLKEKFKGLF
jgi:AsmA protein